MICIRQGRPLAVHNGNALPPLQAIVNKKFALLKH